MTLCLSRALLEQREKLTSRQVSAPVCGDLMQGCDRLCRVAGCGNCEIGEGSKQAANEVWVSLGDMLPDARPLAADVSTAGHAYQSCIEGAALSPENRAGRMSIRAQAPREPTTAAISATRTNTPGCRRRPDSVTARRSIAKRS
jgi:hypothetical protein